jgi:hypothetical protein
MAQSQSGFDVDSYKSELDKISASVMPDTWLGHGRVKIHESELSDKQKTFASNLLDRLGKKYPHKRSELLARKAIEMAEQKID